MHLAIADKHSAVELDRDEPGDGALPSGLRQRRHGAHTQQALAALYEAQAVLVRHPMASFVESRDSGASRAPDAHTPRKSGHEVLNDRSW
jgi:hypothetical protein